MSDAPAPLSPHLADLESDVTLAREQLAATVDALVDQVDPRRQAARLKSRGRRLLFDATDPAALPEARARARRTLVVAGVVVLVVAAGVVRRVTRH